MTKLAIHLSILVMVSLIVGAPLLNRGLFTSADGGHHLVRIAYFSKYLRAGNLFPGWVDELNNHQGYPLFFFVYPLPYYVASGFNLVGLSIVEALKLVVWMFTALGVVGLYLWIAALTNSRGAAVAASFLFFFTPYRFVNLFVRLALGEIVFLGLVPWAFWLIEKKWWSGLVGVVFLMLLSHLQLSVLFLALILVYSWIRRNKIKAVVISLLLAISLAAFFILPALVLLGQTKFFLVHQFPPQEHLPTWRQVLYSPWGFGFSRPGNADGLSFQLGLANWVVLVTTSFISLWRRNWLALSLTGVCWLTLVVMVSSPLGLWSWPAVAALQFPWRLLAVLLVLTPLLLGLVYPLVNKRLMVALLLVLAIYSNRNHIRINQSEYEAVNDTYFLQENTTTTATADEFMPTISKSQFIASPIIGLSRLVSILALGLMVVIYRPTKHVAIRRSYR